MSHFLNQLKRGFTLIELVIVIAILGILAAVAIPKFVNISADAYTSTVQGIAGALGSASAANYVIRTVNSARGVAISNCTDGGTLLQNGLPSGYSISPAAAVSANASATCTLIGPSGSSASASFIINGIG